MAAVVATAFDLLFAGARAEKKRMDEERLEPQQMEQERNSDGEMDTSDESLRSKPATPAFYDSDDEFWNGAPQLQQAPKPTSKTRDLEDYLDRVRQRQEANEERQQPTTKRRPRTKAVALEDLNATKAANAASSSSAAASPPAKRKRTDVPSYNQSALEKANAKAARARFLAEATRYAKENRMRKGDYEVKAVEGMTFCRRRGCKYCRDFKRRMPLWLISYVGYGDDTTWEHWENLDCPELVTAAFYIRANVDPRNERACRLYWSFGIVDCGDGEVDLEPLEEEPEPEIFGNPAEYDWLRLGAPAGHQKPPAADKDDPDNVVITAVRKRGGNDEPFVDKDGVELEPIVLTPLNILHMKADWTRLREAGKNRIAVKLMDEHHWTPRIKPGGPLKGVKAQVCKQLTELGICD